MRGGPLLLCVACHVSVPRREAERRRHARLVVRLQAALRERRGSIVAGAAIAVMVALVAVSSAIPIVSESMRAEMGTPVARAALANRMAHGGEAGPAGGPLSTGPPGAPTRIPTLLFGLALQPIAGAGGANLPALTDGRAGDTAAAWRSPVGRVGAELRFTMYASVLAGKAIFALSNDAPPETWAREVEVWLASSPDAPETLRAGRWTLQQTTAPQAFSFARTPVRSVRLRVLSNHGGAEYTSLAEFALLGA